MLEFKHLLLEATRKCNMICEHCMHRAVKEVTMDYAVIERIFQDTRHIEHLCLIDGEPSLTPYVIQKILYQARRWNSRDSEKEIGLVKLHVEHFPLEDMQNG